MNALMLSLYSVEYKVLKVYTEVPNEMLLLILWGPDVASIC